MAGITGWQASLKEDQPSSPDLTRPHPSAPPQGEQRLGAWLTGPWKHSFNTHDPGCQGGAGGRPLFHLSGGLRGLVAGVQAAEEVPGSLGAGPGGRNVWVLCWLGDLSCAVPSTLTGEAQGRWLQVHLFLDTDALPIVQYVAVYKPHSIF